MKANTRFLGKPKTFWADIKLLSQQIGYAQKKQIKIPTIDEVVKAYQDVNLSSEHVYTQGQITELGKDIIDYFSFRALVINDQVSNSLMDAQEAEVKFNELYSAYKPKCPIPMNKQKGEKFKPAFLTGMVNILIENVLNNAKCNFDPRSLATITRDNRPLRTFSRRFDGAFPDTTNPKIIWEVKEYYYTTTFGSRVADGVYETLLDGLELEELHENENKKIYHFLVIDSKFTWWTCGKSYLCRMIDMLHMGYVDEIFFGKEIIEHLQNSFREWLREH